MSEQASEQLILPEMSAPAARPDADRFMRTTAFVLFTLLVVAGPFVPQVLGRYHPLFRPWTMFSGVGVGILKGEFVSTAQDGSVSRLTPLQMLELERYPRMLSIQYDRLARDREELRRLVAAHCAAGGVTLSFQGVVGTRHGWKPVNETDLCLELRGAVDR